MMHRGVPPLAGTPDPAPRSPPRRFRVAPVLRKNANLAKTITYLVIHLGIGFTVAYAFTGSVTIAGAIAVVEPLCNAVAYFFHEKVWNKALA